MSAGPAFADMPVTYYPYMEQLGEEFHVIAPDMRGQGGTIHTKGPIDFNVLADDVAALIDALDLERAFVAGFSEGGALVTVDRVAPSRQGAGAGEPTLGKTCSIRPLWYSMAPIMFGGSPDATEANPDVFEAFFAQDHGAMFEAVKAHLDRRRAKAVSHVQDAPSIAGRRCPPATPTKTSRRSRCRRCCSSATATTSTPELATAEYRLLPAGELQVLANTEHAVTPEVVEATREILSTASVVGGHHLEQFAKHGRWRPTRCRAAA